MTSAILVQYSTNWTIKPTGSWPHCEFEIYSTAQKKPNREHKHERVQNGYRMGTKMQTEQVQNGYGTDIEMNNYQTDME